MSATVVDALDEMGRELDRKVPDLNYGGCCVYAANVARALINAGIPAWGRALSWRHGEGPSVEEVRREIGDNWTSNLQWEEHGVIFGHVQVQFELDGKTYTTDSHGTYEGQGYRGDDMSPGRIRVEELEKLAATPVGWNSDFNRDKGIPAVQQIVHRYLDAYRDAKQAEYARTKAAM